MGPGRALGIALVARRRSCARLAPENSRALWQLRACIAYYRIPITGPSITQTCPGFGSPILEKASLPSQFRLIRRPAQEGLDSQFLRGRKHLGDFCAVHHVPKLACGLPQPFVWHESCSPAVCTRIFWVILPGVSRVRLERKAT